MVLAAHCTVLVALLGLGGPAEDALEVRRQAAEDDQLLKSAHLPTDGPGLVTFLRKQVLTEADTKRIRALIGQLGAGTFKVRDRAFAELVAHGPAALPLLRAAPKPPDLEGQRRVANCIQAIERVPWAEVVTAAARRLRGLRPAGACAALLASLPLATEEGAEDALLRALIALGSSGEKVDPAFGDALRDPEPLRRAAAALVLGAHGNARQRATVRGVMRTDLYLSVRLRAAQGLLVARDRNAVPVLLAVLAEGRPELASLADELLRRLAGSRAPAAEWAEEATARQKGLAAWRTWWQANRGRPDLDWLDTPLVEVNATLEVRKVALRFFNAVITRDLARFRATTGVPFRLKAEEVARTRQELDEFFAQNMGDDGNSKPSLKAVRVLTVEQYVRGKVDTQEREFLKGLHGSRGRVVLVTAQLDGETMTAPLFVRLGGSGARVVGVGEPRNEEKE